MGPLRLPIVALLLPLISLAIAHDDNTKDAMEMGSIHNLTMPSPLDELHSLPSYAGHEAYSGLMLAHIVFEIFAWLFVLPIGTYSCKWMAQITLTGARDHVQRESIATRLTNPVPLPPYQCPWSPLRHRLQCQHARLV